MGSYVRCTIENSGLTATTMRLLGMPALESGMGRTTIYGRCCDHVWCWRLYTSLILTLFHGNTTEFSDSKHLLTTSRLDALLYGGRKVIPELSDKSGKIHSFHLRTAEEMRKAMTARWSQYKDVSTVATRWSTGIKFAFLKGEPPEEGLLTSGTTTTVKRQGQRPYILCRISTHLVAPLLRSDLNECTTDASEFLADRVIC